MNVSMFWVILLPLVVLFVLFVARKDPPPIYGVYNQPGKWYNVKYWIFSIMMKRRKRKCVIQTQALTGKDAGYGMKSRSSEKEMDSIQQLPLEHPLV